MEWNRVWAVGRDTYLRAYPNPGLGVCWGQHRLALSLHGGLELFRRSQRPGLVWQRVWSFASRVKRPGALG